jgi:hypothetical protein
MWPDPKPTLKALKRLAKDSGLWIRVGRAIGLPEKDLDRFLAHLCSSSTATPRVRTGMYAAPSPGAAYAKALELLIVRKQKPSDERMTRDYMNKQSSEWNARLRGAKR